MRWLFKGAKIYFPGSTFHGKQIDFIADNGTLRTEGLLAADETVEAAGLTLVPGFADIFAHFNDPGLEHNETLETGSNAAIAGGFTDVMLLPNTQPVIDSKSQVSELVNANQTSAINIYPIGAVTKNTEGRELAEMYDMKNTGAVAFSDGLRPIQDAGIFVKALEYIKANRCTIIQVPRIKSIAERGLMNEGVTSVRAGLLGIPAIAEELMVYRDIELVRYANSSLHIAGVSTARGLNMIKEAKADGLNVTCSIAPYQLVFTDAALETYDTNLKLCPPLRGEKDRDAMRMGVRDGTIDTIASFHLPHRWDDKQKEFEYADEGMVSLQTAFPLLLQYAGLERAIEMACFANRKIFDLPMPAFEKDRELCFNLIAPDRVSVFSKESNRSKSDNSPFWGQALKGVPAFTFNKKRLFAHGQS